MANKVETEKVAELIAVLGFANVAQDLRSHRYTAEESLKWLIKGPANAQERALLQQALDALEPPRTYAIYRGL